MYLHIIAGLIECVWGGECCVGRWAVVGMDVCARASVGGSAVLCIRNCVSCI